MGQDSGTLKRIAYGAVPDKSQRLDFVLLWNALYGNTGLVNAHRNALYPLKSYRQRGFWRQAMYKAGFTMCEKETASFYAPHVHLLSGLLNQCGPVNRWYTRLYRGYVPELCP